MRMPPNQSRSDLKKYIHERKKRDTKFAEGYEEGYEQFKIGVMLRQAREAQNQENCDFQDRESRGRHQAVDP